MCARPPHRLTTSHTTALASLLFATLLAGSLCTDCTGSDRFMGTYLIMAGVCALGYILCMALVLYLRHEERVWFEQQEFLAEVGSSQGRFDVYGAVKQ